MEMIIDIPDKIKGIIDSHEIDKYSNVQQGFIHGIIESAIEHGTPLPKNHGRLIDADSMIADILTVNPQFESMIEWCTQVINAQPTVIEAEVKSDDE